MLIPSIIQFVWMRIEIHTQLRIESLQIRIKFLTEYNLRFLIEYSHVSDILRIQPVFLHIYAAMWADTILPLDNIDPESIQMIIIIDLLHLFFR